MVKLYPRLTATDAHSLWESGRTKTISQLKLASGNSHPNQFFAAIGGQRIQPVEIGNFASDIRKIAKDFGYPETSRRKELADFDTAVAIHLGSEFDIPLGEAYRPETWAFLSLVVLPDVVKWRFTEFHPSRCTGGRRDCFQRLWLRAKAFDLGAKATNRWVILNHLNEDSFVSILERPSLAGNYELCKILGTTWMKTATRLGKGQMESVNRKAIKQVRSKCTLLLFDALSQTEMKQVVEQCYLAESVT